MEVRINTKEPLSDALLEDIQGAFGFDAILDHNEPGDMDYFVGYDPENVGVEGCCDKDPMPYDEAVRLCGWLAKRGIEGWVDGDGAWANGMFRQTDFTSFAVSDDQKYEWARIARIYWQEADPERLSDIAPNAKESHEQTPLPPCDHDECSPARCLRGKPLAHPSCSVLPRSCRTCSWAANFGYGAAKCDRGLFPDAVCQKWQPSGLLSWPRRIWEQWRFRRLQKLNSKLNEPSSD